MAEPKLEIIPKKYSGESTVISMRISKAMLADIDKLAAETGRTRNELMAEIWRDPPTKLSEPASTAEAQ